MDLSRHVVRCIYCNTSQRARDCKRHTLAQLQVDIEGKSIWLTAFSYAIEDLLVTNKDVGLESDSDKIEDALLALVNIMLKYNITKLAVTKVLKVSSSSNLDAPNVASTSLMKA